MRRTMRLFQIGLKQVTRDGMLLVLLPAPFLVGLIFKFGIPVINEITETQFSFSIQQWYRLVDGILICLTPMFIAMVSAFLLLEERDEGIASFYQITPVGDYSYLTARIGIPMIYAFIATVIAVKLFNISAISTLAILVGSLISTLIGTVLATAIVKIAGNRLEGLAVSKFMGVIYLGLIAVWFILFSA